MGSSIGIVKDVVEVGALILGGLWHVVRLEVKLAVLQSKVDMLIQHTGLGQSRERR